MMIAKVRERGGGLNKEARKVISCFTALNFIKWLKRISTEAVYDMEVSQNGRSFF